MWTRSTRLTERSGTGGRPNTSECGVRTAYVENGETYQATSLPRLKSALRQFFQRGEETWTRDHRSIRPVDRGFAFCTQGCDRKSHRYSVIAKGIYFRSVQGLCAWNLQSVLAFFDLCSHSSEIACNRSDPVRFLYSQFMGIAHFDAACGVRRDRSQYWNFIDERRTVRTSDGRSAQTTSVHFHSAD